MPTLVAPVVTTIIVSNYNYAHIHMCIIVVTLNCYLRLAYTHGRQAWQKLCMLFSSRGCIASYWPFLWKCEEPVSCVHCLHMHQSLYAVHGCDTKLMITNSASIL